jgi:hypothetical protein
MLRDSPTRMRLVALVLCPMLLSCGTAPRALSSDGGGPTSPTGPRDLARFVLVIREAPEGDPVHEWRPVSGLDVSEFLGGGPSAGGERYSGKFLLATWNRDCEQERDTCEDNCMNSDLGPDWSHIKTRGAKYSECSKRCLKPYIDCCRLRELESEEFRSIHEAVDWLKRHRTEVLVGTSVVIAGVVFVVVVAGTGGAALVLVPAVLMASAQFPLDPHVAAVRP